MSNAGKMRHIADIYEPSGELDGRGQSKASTPYLKGIPCSVKDVSGREYEQARSLYGDATLIVGMYGDPKHPISKNDTVKLNGTRKLLIGYVKDVHQNGVELELLCSEDRK